MIEFITLFFLFYLWHALGVTIGYHRLLSHRSFSCPKIVEYFFVAGGYLAFEGSPIWWATMHRAHHRHVDTALDPHSPRFGLKHAHTGWLGNITYPAHIDPAAQSKDLIKDPIYQYLEQGGVLRRAHAVSLILGISFRVLLLVCFGWIPALASALAGVAVLQIPLMLNVVCHIPKLGYKNFAVDDDSVNVWWVALLAVGEGWHNNHHAFPGSAKTGMRAWEFDLSWLLILLMNRLGLVKRMTVATPEQMARARQESSLRLEELLSLPEKAKASAANLLIESQYPRKALSSLK
jgi:stearoyl-CoA desaturase (delta-9 desaturase)